MRRRLGHHNNANRVGRNTSFKDALHLGRRNGVTRELRLLRRYSRTKHELSGRVSSAEQGFIMTAVKRRRCVWAEGSPVMQHYHDTEWGVPQRDSRALWEMLMLEGFQAGLAWIVVLRKRDAFRAAFSHFRPEKVARYREKDVARLLGNADIIRSRAKIESTIAGAKIYCEMAARGEDFGEFCWSFTQKKVLKGDGKHVPASSPLSERISKELKRRGFKFVGPTIVYAWMQSVGIVNDHAATCYRRTQV